MGVDGWLRMHLVPKELRWVRGLLRRKNVSMRLQAYKDALLASSETDTSVIKRTIGAPARALTGPWTEKILGMEDENADYEQFERFY